ncbi:MAG: hypothetical protein ABIH67_00240 [Candidatus Uhrbacteria bacterium]
MKKHNPDYLSRRPVYAIILASIDANEHLVSKQMPEGYWFSNGTFRFPAGVWESYFINGKEYNAEGNRTLEEQKELMAIDLAEEEFNQEEVAEFIAEIEVREGQRKLLTPEASNKWLKHHPEFERDALRLLDRIKNEVQSEMTREPGRGMRKK